MVKAVLPKPGSIIELSAEQKEELPGKVIGLLVRGKYIFLFNQEAFEKLIELRLKEIEDLKQRRKFRAFIDSQVIDINNFRTPRASRSQKRMLVTV